MKINALPIPAQNLCGSAPPPPTRAFADLLDQGKRGPIPFDAAGMIRPSPACIDDFDSQKHTPIEPYGAETEPTEPAAGQPAPSAFDVCAAPRNLVGPRAATPTSGLEMRRGKPTNDPHAAHGQAWPAESTTRMAQALGTQRDTKQASQIVRAMVPYNVVFSGPNAGLNITLSGARTVRIAVSGSGLSGEEHEQVRRAVALVAQTLGLSVEATAFDGRLFTSDQSDKGGRHGGFTG